jgi:mono/diheme cytochrome c family protein
MSFSSRLSILMSAATTLVASLGAAAEVGGSTTFIDQGWSKEIREQFYFTPQGSRIMPYAWFVGLETLDDKGMLADPANLERYGFIRADGPHALNPGGLPIGFAVDPARTASQSEGASAAVPSEAMLSRGQQVGLTCSACHTANITVNGRAIRIDGAPARLDLDSFYADLSAAVDRTFFDIAAFQRFADRVLNDPSPAATAELRLLFAEFQARLAGDAMIRHPTLASGFGRLDALTQSINSLAGVDQGDARNLRAVNAPTSFPQLWLTPQLEFVQWSPIAASPIGRNGGEVLAVFGAATLTGPPDGWLASTILIKELQALENWIADLKPPAWDEAIFGSVDRTLAMKGEALFREHCASCHNSPPYRRTAPADNAFGKTFIEIGRIDYRAVGTDPAYIRALERRLVRTNAATAPVHAGAPVVTAAAYFLKTVGAIVKRAMKDAGIGDTEQLVLSGFRLRPPATPGGQPTPYAPPAITDLKAGPLPGIWATGPFLHNGSVPTIYELLSPVNERRSVFWTGGRELDHRQLGFESDERPDRFRFDTSLQGNQNTGHMYPREGLDNSQRMAIIEYLKLL